MTTTDPIRKLNTLTERQKEVLRLRCEDLEYKDIGAKLVLTVGAIKSHMGNIYRKLELTHLNRDQRILNIRDVYCPLLKENSTSLTVVEEEVEPEPISPESERIEEVEPEPISPEVEKAEEEVEPEPISPEVKKTEDEVEPEPISPEVEKMVEEDEYALMNLESSEIIEGEIEEIPPRRIGGCTWALIGIILGSGLMAVLFFFLGGNIPGFNIPGMPLDLTEELAASTEPPVASLTPEVIVVTATPLPASETPMPTETPLPTKTPLPTETAEPTSTPTTIPSATPVPNTEPGTILEVGEWWIKDGVWVRLGDYKIDDGWIYLYFEIWNQSDRTLYFSWTRGQNFPMVDNLNNRYEVLSPSMLNETTVEVNERKELLPSNLANTVKFYDDPLFNAGVTDLFITMEYLSIIDKATFHIPVGQ